MTGRVEEESESIRPDVDGRVGKGDGAHPGGVVIPGMDPEIARIMEPNLRELERMNRKVNVSNPLTFKKRMTY